MKQEILTKLDDEGRVPAKVNHLIREILSARRKKQVLITIEDKRSAKSQAQLGYWFGLVVLIFCRHTGYTEKEIHNILKYKAGFIEETEIDGKKVIIIKSLKDATKMDMMAIIEAVKEWATFLGLTIPEPDVFWKETKELK